MSRRVRIAAVALFALILVVQSPSVAAATRDREVSSPSFVEKVVRIVKKAVKPLMPSSSNDDGYIPTPPKP